MDVQLKGKTDLFSKRCKRLINCSRSGLFYAQEVFFITQVELIIQQSEDIILITTFPSFQYINSPVSHRDYKKYLFSVMILYLIVSDYPVTRINLVPFQ